VSKLVAQAARPRPKITVTVNGKRWQLVSGLTDSGPRDRVYTVSQTADDRTVVTFGDGVHGARPPAGSEITVGYRSGSGAGGNTVTLAMKPAALGPTPDQALWVVIRNQTDTIRLEFFERRPRTASRKNRY
jgi:hypothetical protein